MSRKKRINVGPISIQPGEHLVASLRPAWRYYIRYYLFSYVIVSILSLSGGREGVLSVFLPVTIIITCLVVLSRYSNLFIITTQRVIEQTGLISRYTGQVNLKNIHMIDTKQGIIDRLFRVGQVRIESAGQISKGGDIVFGGVLDPVAVKEIIHRLEYKQRKSFRKKLVANYKWRSHP